jgi:hypothetical protein
VLRRFCAILLLACFLAQGAGWARHLHDWQHAIEDAQLAATPTGAGSHSHAHGHARHVHDVDPWDDGAPAEPGKAPPLHDDSNCAVHLQLNAPTTGAAWTPVLIVLGPPVASLTLLTPTCVSRAPAMRLACRGPPVA